MNLQIRDPRARDMARQLARRNGTTMTEAVVEALDFRLKHAEPKLSLIALAATLRHELKRRATGVGRMIDDAEVDELWGHDAPHGG